MFSTLAVTYKLTIEIKKGYSVSSVFSFASASKRFYPFTFFPIRRLCEFSIFVLVSCSASGFTGYAADSVSEFNYDIDWDNNCDP